MSNWTTKCLKGIWVQPRNHDEYAELCRMFERYGIEFPRSGFNPKLPIQVDLDKRTAETIVANITVLAGRCSSLGDPISVSEFKEVLFKDYCKGLDWSKGN